MYFVCYMSYIIYPYNKESQRKENVIKKIIKKMIVQCCIYQKKKTPKTNKLPSSNWCFSRLAVILTTRKKRNQGHEESGQIMDKCL